MREAFYHTTHCSYNMNYNFFFSLRSALLRVWKREKGKKATYHALLKALVKSKNADSAEVIVTVLNGKLAQEPCYFYLCIATECMKNNKKVLLSILSLTTSDLHTAPEQRPESTTFESCERIA